MRSPGEMNLNRDLEMDLTDPRVLDRLVDGELTDEQERAVIARLDQAPDGWRRCALAFLETRCWQRATVTWQEPAGGTASRISLSPPKTEQRGTGARRRGGGTIRWPGALAMCALFLLAFTVGMLLPKHGHRSPPRQIAQPDAQGQPIDHALAQANPASTTSTLPQAGSTGSIDSADLLLGNLSFVDNTGRQYHLPVYDWNQQVAEQLMYPSQPLSSEFVQHLKRHQVRSHQSYVPVKLDDGRQVVFPVQEVDIVPVGGTAY